MRWFKHMTNTRDDEKIAKLIAEAGMEGYGFYWSIIELVAKQIEKGSDKCSVTYPLPYLSRQLYLHHNKVSNLLGKLQVTGLIQLSKVEVSGGVNFTITCPNLLKYRDEYATRKAKNRDKLPSNSRVTPEQDTDTEIDTEAELEQSTLPKKHLSVVSTPNGQEASTISAIQQTMKKLSISPLEASNLISAIKAGVTVQTVKNLLKRKPTISGFTHQWQLDELMAQKRIDEESLIDPIDAELIKKFGSAKAKTN